MKRKRNRGFTLVELIVVLVVLAILAAIMVPTMIGWIDKSKEKKILLAARSLYTASQAVLTEEYAMCSDPTIAPTTESLKNSGRTDEILKLAGTPEGVSCSIGVMGEDSFGNYIVKYTYYAEDATGIAVYFDGSSWETVEEGLDVSKATICLKGTPVKGGGPGAWATELLDKFPDKYTVRAKSILSNLASLEQEALYVYKQNRNEETIKKDIDKFGRPGYMGYRITVDKNGNITKKEPRDEANIHESYERNLNNDKDADLSFYIIISGDKIGTNLSIDKETGVVKTHACYMRYHYGYGVNTATGFFFEE